MDNGKRTEKFIEAQIFAETKWREAIFCDLFDITKPNPHNLLILWAVVIASLTNQKQIGTLNVHCATQTMPLYIQIVEN